MESNTAEKIPVPLHELSAMQLNQLDPFRSFYKIIFFLNLEYQFSFYETLFYEILFVWNILRDDPAAEETNELEQFAPIGKLYIV